MAAAGTLTKLSANPATASFNLTFGYWLLIVTEEVATGKREVRRFKYTSAAQATEVAFSAQKAGYGVAVEEVFVRAN